MNSGRPVDLDTLADYVEGVLDDNDAAEVAALIADDPAWSVTYAQLTDALPQVGSALAEVPAEPMPAEVSLRIGAALGALQRPTNVVPIGQARSSRARYGKRSTWLKVAAAVIFLGLFLGLLPRVLSSSTSDSGTRNNVESGSAGIARPEAVGPVRLTASGRDYSKSALTARPGPNLPPLAAGTSAPSGAPATRAPSIIGNGETFGAATVPPLLHRLTAQPALDECLSDVAAAVGGTPATVDFAQYAHQPALIIGFTDLPYSVAVGPACGESGADVLARG